MTAEPTDQHAGAPWLTISELAERQRAAKSTISEKVSALEADGRLRTRRDGRSKLVSLPAFLEALAGDSDPARELGLEARYQDGPFGSEQPEAASPGYRDAQTRKAQADAALREFDLRKRQGELVEISDLKAAAETCADTINAVIERLPGNAAEMVTAVNRESTRGAREQYKRDARGLRAAIVDAFDRLLSSFQATESMKVGSAETAPLLWGDLDPQDYASDR